MKDCLRFFFCGKSRLKLNASTYDRLVRDGL
jgi:hypothetical protein